MHAFYRLLKQQSNPKEKIKMVKQQWNKNRNEIDF